MVERVHRQPRPVQGVQHGGVRREGWQRAWLCGACSFRSIGRRTIGRSVRAEHLGAGRARWICCSHIRTRPHDPMPHTRSHVQAGRDGRVRPSDGRQGEARGKGAGASRVGARVPGDRRPPVMPAAPSAVESDHLQGRGRVLAEQAADPAPSAYRARPPHDHADQHAKRPRRHHRPDIGHPGIQGFGNRVDEQPALADAAPTHAALPRLPARQLGQPVRGRRTDGAWRWSQHATRVQTAWIAGAPSSQGIHGATRCETVDVKGDDSPRPGAARRQPAPSRAPSRTPDRTS